MIVRFFFNKKQIRDFFADKPKDFEVKARPFACGVVVFY
jgi:hypothetical protein